MTYITHAEMKRWQLDEFDTLYTRDWLYPFAVFNWLTSNINTINDLAFRNRRRQLFCLGEQSFSIRVVRRKPLMRIQCRWTYLSDESKIVPRLRLANKFSKGLSVRRKKSSNAEELSGRIDVSLIKWPNLVRGTLNKQVISYIHGDSECVKSRACLLNEIEILLGLINTSVTPEHLILAVQLDDGLEDCEAFIAWLDEHQHQKPALEVCLPIEMA